MSGVTLLDSQWDKLAVFLKGCSGIYIGKEEDCRLFIGGILWMTRSGAQWRLLPEKYGDWNSVFKRFNRWSKQEVWKKMHTFFANDPDMESIMIDSTVVRAHPCAAGAMKKDGQEQNQALGRSRGGFSTKVHVLVDALGNPLDFILTGGQVADVTQAKALLEGRKAGNAIMDKAYDADEILNQIDSQGMTAVIPPKSNRKTPRDYDWYLYKERHLVECFINKIKHYRRVFARFDKTARNFMSFIRFAATLIWLR